MPSKARLTIENYSKGFLIDEELMGGVSEHPASKGRYLAYVLRPATAEYLGYQDFGTLEQAIEAVNAIQRDWKYEPASGCKTGNCGKTGSCDKGCKGCALGDRG